MTRTYSLLGLGVLVLMGAACSGGAGTTVVAASALESCFDVGGARVECMKTPSGPQTQPMDINHDGRVDTFVCATGPSGRVSGDDGDRDHDGVPDDEDCDVKSCVPIAKPQQEDNGADADRHGGGGGGGSSGDVSDDTDGDDMDCPAGTS
jgi:hypothetical protein